MCSLSVCQRLLSQLLEAHTGSRPWGVGMCVCVCVCEELGVTVLVGGICRQGIPVTLRQVSMMESVIWLVSFMSL